MVQSPSRPPPTAPLLLEGPKLSGGCWAALFPPLPPPISSRLEAAPTGPPNTPVSATYLNLLLDDSPKSMGGRGPKHNLAASERQATPPPLRGAWSGGPGRSRTDLPLEKDFLDGSANLGGCRRAGASPWSCRWASWTSGGGGRTGECLGASEGLPGGFSLGRGGDLVRRGWARAKAGSGATSLPFRAGGQPVRRVQPGPGPLLFAGASRCCSLRCITRISG